MGIGSGHSMTYDHLQVGGERKISSSQAAGILQRWRLRRVKIQRWILNHGRRVIEESSGRSVPWLIQDSQAISTWGQDASGMDVGRVAAPDAMLVVFR